MLEAELFLKSREEELDVFIRHIKYTMEQPGNIQNVLMLKSSFILHLYNIIESSFSLIIEHIHEEGSKYKFNELPNSLKLIYTEFYLENRKVHLKKQYLEKTISREIYFPTYGEYVKRNKIFSGNLDTDKIRKILGTYGINTKNDNKLQSDTLLFIKRKRCQLAHGEIGFKDACKNISFQELLKMKSEVFIILHHLKSITEKYLSNILNTSISVRQDD